MRSIELVATGKPDGKVYKWEEINGRLVMIRMNPPTPLNEYMNGIQMYNTNEGHKSEDYFEKDPFTRRQNEIIKTMESHPRIQKEYSILKDCKLTTYITKVLYSLIGKQYKDGKTKKFPLIEFFKQLSKEEEIRELYESKLCTAELPKNPLDFKDLKVEKWDRVNWLIEKKLINI